MNIFMSSFITGFQNEVNKSLQKFLNGVKIKHLFDGIIVYEYNGNWKNILNIPYLNNSFLVSKIFYGKNLNFLTMTKQICKMKNFKSINMKSFRVRFSKENQFVAFDKKNIFLVEQFLNKNTNMKIDRLNPNTEFWFIIRRENIGFFGQLLEKRKTTEKQLNQGELRPEFAYLMCEFADIKSTICEPFAGNGAIPLQINKKFKFKELYISDLNNNCVNFIKSKSEFKNNRKVFINNFDALKLDGIKNYSIDLIITDPPWGIYQQIEDIEKFYIQMLRCFKTKIKKNSRVVILTAKKEELIQASKIENFKILKRVDTLVNGKKSALFFLVVNEK